MLNLSGVLPSPPDARDYPAAAVLAKVPRLPSAVRMDHEIGIRDQGFFGVCVGKSGAELMSAKLRKKLSSLFLYTRCKQLDGIPNQQGTYVRTALKVMQKDGVCLDKTLPYDKLKDHDHLPALTPDMYNEASSYKIETYARANNIHEIKEALANGHLVIAVMLIGDNFIHYNGGVMGQAEGTLYGYHAVILCGYNDLMQAVGGRGANSWSAGWGEDGFFWLSYNALNSPTLVEAWIVEVKKKSNGGVNMFWKEKEFWLAVIAVVVPILNHFLGFGMDAATLAAIILPIIALIFGFEWKEVQMARVEVQWAKLNPMFEDDE